MRGWGTRGGGGFRVLVVGMGLSSSNGSRCERRRRRRSMFIVVARYRREERWRGVAGGCLGGGRLLQLFARSPGLCALRLFVALDSVSRGGGGGDAQGTSVLGLMRKGCCCVELRTRGTQRVGMQLRGFVGTSRAERGRVGQQGVFEVVNAVMKRTGRLFSAGRLESNTCGSERLRQKLGGRKGE